MKGVEKVKYMQHGEEERMNTRNQEHQVLFHFHYKFYLVKNITCWNFGLERDHVTVWHKLAAPVVI